MHSTMTYNSLQKRMNKNNHALLQLRYDAPFYENEMVPIIVVRPYTSKAPGRFTSSRAGAFNKTERKRKWK